MRPTSFSISKRLQSFKYAFKGLRILIKDEHNARIHLLASIVAIALSLILNINSTEWVAVFLCIGFVLVTEIINTSIEKICDFIYPQKHPLIKEIKDLAAAAVLTASVISFVIACIVFIPKL